MKELSKAIGKAEAGERLGFKTARSLYGNAELLVLGRLANAARFRHNPDPVVTYAVDRNINYTNICSSKCQFCAFWHHKDHAEAYVIDRDTLRKKLEETKALGGTQILFQGGLNSDLDLAWHEEQIRLMRSMGLHVHGYSPPEIIFLARQNGMDVAFLLERFKAAGLGSIPGGGAEILSDRVRQKISPAKVTSKEWLQVMETAHGLGLKTTATMMFGHVETEDERLAHLFRIRRLQDKSHGFTAFIPWPYQPGERTLQANPAGGVSYLRILALSRLVLDNVPHIQASWVTQGARVGQVALHFGADDFGSTMIEENVVAAAGVRHRMKEADIVRLIQEAGFEAQQRDTLYQRVHKA
jgi:cyclic dehypoxanthinyl futalosine synthase